MPSNLSPEEIKTLQRKPSYLLWSLILEDMHYGYQGEESLEKGNIFLKKRKLLTAQTAAIELEVETLRDKMLIEAASSERYMPLPVDAANLERFAGMSRDAIIWRNCARHRQKVTPLNSPNFPSEPTAS